MDDKAAFPFGALVGLCPERFLGSKVGHRIRRVFQFFRQPLSFYVHIHKYIEPISKPYQNKSFFYKITCFQAGMLLLAWGCSGNEEKLAVRTDPKGTRRLQEGTFMFYTVDVENPVVVGMDGV